MFETTVAVVGSVVTEPRVRETSGGDRVASFRVLSTARRYERQAQRWVDGDRFFATVLCWRHLADGVARDVQKRSSVVVSGRLRTREYESGGQWRSVVEIEANAVGLDLGRRARADAAVGAVEAVGAGPAPVPDEAGPGVGRPPAAGPEVTAADARQEQAAQQQAEPEDAAPHDAEPHDAAPHDAAPHDAAPEGRGLEAAAPEEAGLQGAALQETALRETAPQEAVPQGRARSLEVSLAARPDVATVHTAGSGMTEPDDTAAPNPAGPDQVGSDKAFPDQAFSDKAFPDKAFPDQADPEQAAPDQAGRGVADADRTRLRRPGAASATGPAGSRAEVATRCASAPSC